jgi:GAF domain-containing protein
MEQDGLETKRGSFLYRERIKSTAGILLKNGAEVVGVALVHYRRNKRFIYHDKSIMETFSSIAAMSLKNLRLLKTMATIEFVADDCDQIFAEIIKRAVLVTSANRGIISGVDETKGETVVLAIYPHDADVNTDFLRMDIDQGVTGSLIKNLHPILVPDFRVEPDYKPFFPDLASALCFPIVDNKKVIGLINLESRRINWFKDLELQIMKSLANQALIAMKFCVTKFNK